MAKKWTFVSRDNNPLTEAPRVQTVTSRAERDRLVKACKDAGVTVDVHEINE